MLQQTREQVLRSVLDRSRTDHGFRARLLVDPRAAIEEVFGVVVPHDFRVKFIERERGVDALIVLPDLQPQSGELSDGELEAVAGGAENAEMTWSE